MKKILLAVLFFSSITSFAQQKFTLKGKVGNLNAPSIVYLRYANDGKAVMDSAVPVNGKFSFKGDIPEPVKATLLLNHTGTGRAADMLQIYLLKSTIGVNSRDSVKNASVKGGKLNKDLQKLNLATKPANDKMRALNAEYAALSAEQRKDKQIMEGITKRSEVINKELKAAQKKYIQENKASIVSLDVLQSYGGYAPEYSDVEPLFSALSADVQNSKGGKDYVEKLEKMKMTAVGAMAPEFTQNDVDGKPVSLSSFRGKYVLIDFWASWCGPCRAENPNVVKAYNKYKDKNFTVLGVSLDQPNAKDKWLKAIADDHLDWTQVSDLKFWKNEVAVQYGINAIPQNFLVAPDGKIIAKNIRGEELQTKLDEVINKGNKPGV